MNKAITFGGQTFVPDTSGALYWPDEKTLMVADLHFEKASHFAAKGYHLPPYDSLETLNRLRAVIERFAPTKVIALGDSWHDDAAPDRMAAEDGAALQAITNMIEFIWISGNHDPKPTRFGAHVAHYDLNGFACIHEATRHATGPTFCGHYHPKIRIRLKKTSRALPCFAVYDSVCVLPSFGAFTGGLDITHDALTKPLGMPHTVYACGKQRVYQLALEKPLQTGASDAA
jgi:hypothetical protein